MLRQQELEQVKSDLFGEASDLDACFDQMMENQRPPSHAKTTSFRVQSSIICNLEIAAGRHNLTKSVICRKLLGWAVKLLIGIPYQPLPIEADLTVPTLDGEHDVQKELVWAVMMQGRLPSRGRQYAFKDRYQGRRGSGDYAELACMLSFEVRAGLRAASKIHRVPPSHIVRGVFEYALPRLMAKPRVTSVA